MPNVLVPMRPIGAAADRFDLSGLGQYGAIQYAFDAPRAPSLKPTESLERMVDRIRELPFDPKTDFVCPFSPDPFAAFTLGMLFGAVDFGADEIRFLRYDRPILPNGTRASRGVYVPVAMALWPLERL